MRDLPLVALRAFAAVYAHRGVRAAARELGVAHSSVSRHLAELAAWMGVPLIEDGARRRAVTFTREGDELGRAACAGLQQIANVVEALREAKSSRSVTIATAPSFAARWLVPRLPAFERAHPRLEVSVLVNQRLDDLTVGGIDLAIRMGSGPWQDVQPVASLNEMLYPVMSRTLWQRTSKPDELADLRRLRLLHDRDPRAAWETWRRVHGPRALNVRAGPRFASSDLLLQAALQGQGVALARHHFAAEYVASGALVRLFDASSLELGPEYWLLLPPRGSVRSATAAVIAWLKRQASWVDSAASPDAR
ncbi:MAG TPA: LysR substrate-binding domain-containing protein [Steroidobacteraceae bacterium]|nr:LysR substrate-binding domain-containing protein [Steroidobacteraceae bacterium]